MLSIDENAGCDAEQQENELHREQWVIQLKSAMGELPSEQLEVFVLHAVTRVFGLGKS